MIELQGIHKLFGPFHALEDVSLAVGSGELMALLGPSGSGKTTLLRIIAGLETPDRGSVVLEGKEATSRAARDRGVGFVFQHYALFRHMSVFDNIAFGLEVRPRELRPSPAEVKGRVEELLRLVGLEAWARHLPWQLSGGQRQRVALARALAVEPRVLLLDEPFGALDANVRRELRHWLRGLHDQIGVTTVFVTHDQEEALELADRITIFHAGRVAQIGSPAEVYDHPSSAFVCTFLGRANLLATSIDDGRITIGGGALALGAAPAGIANPVACIRANEMEVGESGEGEGFDARVVTSRRVGSDLRLSLVVSWGETVQLEMPFESGRVPVAGETLRLRPRRVHLVPRD